MADSGARAVEERWVNVLAHIYASVKWKRIRGRRPLDVFEHRLEFSKYEPDVPTVLQRLGNTLGLQGLNIPVEDVEYLRQHEEEAMDMLRKWTKLLALKASVKAKEIKRAKQQEAEEKKSKKQLDKSGEEVSG
ncbi:MAG: hypothetical protein JHC26_00320 [Thermofilum sp.]|uniref:hypothetical protein n=1 Tax=Thermofilum sp. TaxID=1961369 RepID=UPI0025873771|nr:hypothetical protein [Thermofilum sp.]MCI4407509.1 hypothetical protein [Thermofilum sp.]